MSTAVLVQQASGVYSDLLRLCEPIHAEYCERHGIHYAPFHSKPGELPPGVSATHRHPFWWKLALLRDYAKGGWDYLIWLDADCLIVGDEDLRNGCPESGIGVTYHSLDWGDLAPTCFDCVNCGSMYIRNTEDVRDFMEKWWAWPEHTHPWGDQYSLHQLMEKHPGVVKVVPHRWNSTPPYFEAPLGEEVVRAWHGAFVPKERLECMKSCVENFTKTGVPRESAYWLARHQSDKHLREWRHGMKEAA